MSDLLEARDALEQDMAEHERGRGREVSALVNQSLAADAMQQLEKVQAEARPAPNPAPPPAFAGERDGQHGTYLLNQAHGDDVRTRTASPAELWFMTHALPRIELLLEKRESGPLGSPSWRDKTLAVMQLQMQAAGFRAQGLEQSARDREQRYLFDLAQLLDASDAVFRPSWKADAERRIQVQVR